MILSSPETRFKEALEDHNHDSTMIALMLRCIAKALECESQRQGTINLLTMLESSYFVEFNILYFMLDLQENEMVKNIKMIKDIMSLLIAFAQNIPQYSQTPFRLFSASENIISIIKETWVSGK